MTSDVIAICKNCGAAINGKYCKQCGQKTEISRITLHSIFHEVFHYFTHVDKGLGYTLKELIKRPGTMQKEYVEGKRNKHQKPFSMFFLCGTISGLGYYFINLAYQNIYGANTTGEADFFRHYFVLKEAILLPVYSLINWLFFKNSKRNYAEMLVLMLYVMSLVFLVLIVINAVKLIFPDYENRYVEVAFLLIYTNMTNLNFFTEKRWLIIAKTILSMSACFTISQLVNEFVVKQLFHL